MLYGGIIMTFQITIFVFGGILFLLGLVGKLMIKDFNIGTDNFWVRGFAFVIGVAFIILSFIITNVPTKETLARIEELNNTVSVKEETIDGLKQSLQELSQEEEKVQTERDNAIAESKQLNDLYTESVKKNEDLQTKVANLTTDLATAEAQIDSLKKANETLENQITNLNTELKKEKDSRIAYEALQQTREDELTEELSNECITKLALQQHREEAILQEIEKLKQECQNQRLVDEILQKYRREVQENE